MPSSEVMHKFKHGLLHSGSKHGPKVRSRAQAIAIAASEKREEDSQGGHYPEGVGHLESSGSSHKGTKKKGKNPLTHALARNR